jgi:Pyridoxamine 5'-phosphate oxidase
VTSEVIPDRATAYGERVRRRLTEEMTIWLTTVGRDGTPQPNPVGFLWDRGDSLLTYSQTEARRLANIRRQPLVSLNFDRMAATTSSYSPAPPRSSTNTRRCRTTPRGWRSMARPSARGSVAPRSSRRGSRSRSASTSPASAAPDAPDTYDRDLRSAHIRASRARNSQVTATSSRKWAAVTGLPGPSRAGA